MWIGSGYSVVPLGACGSVVDLMLFLWMNVVLLWILADLLPLHFFPCWIKSASFNHLHSYCLCCASDLVDPYLSIFSSIVLSWVFIVHPLLGRSRVFFYGFSSLLVSLEPETPLVSRWLFLDLGPYTCCMCREHFPCAFCFHVVVVLQPFSFLSVSGTILWF